MKTRLEKQVGRGTPTAKPLRAARGSEAAQYLYMVAAKKSSKHCKGIIPWERTNHATRTGFGRLARWVKSQGIKVPPNADIRRSGSPPEPTK